MEKLKPSQNITTEQFIEGSLTKIRNGDALGAIEFARENYSQVRKMSPTDQGRIDSVVDYLSMRQRGLRYKTSVSTQEPQPK